MDHIEFFESLYQKDYDESIQRQKKYVESFGSEDGYPKLDGYPKYDDIYLKISNYDINKFDWLYPKGCLIR